MVVNDKTQAYTAFKQLNDPYSTVTNNINTAVTSRPSSLSHNYRLNSQNLSGGLRLGGLAVTRSRTLVTASHTMKKQSRDCLSASRYS